MNVKKLFSGAGVLGIASALLAGTPVSAQTITVTSGFLDMNPSSGPLMLAGTRGFTLTSQVNAVSGVFDPTLCNDICVPGAIVSLRASWSGRDLTGVATVDGAAYAVGTVDPSNSMSVEFTGSAVLPPISTSSLMITAPFALDGSFSYAKGGSIFRETLGGAGTAILTLQPSRCCADRWSIRRVQYIFGTALPFPWVDADIGATGQAGNAAFADGNFYVDGAGADIWGAADAFHFTYQSLPNDGGIVARVVSETPTDQYAKAGIMIRESTDSQAANVILDVKPNGSIEFMTRTASGTSTTFVAEAATSFPVWLKLSRNGQTVSGGISFDNSTWIAIGSVSLRSWTNSTVPIIGLAVTSHTTALLNQAVFDNVNVVTAPSLPAPWTQSDVGAVGQPGGASYSEGVFTVAGAGGDIWGTSDAFHFVYQPLIGDGNVIARLMGEQGTDSFAKAGVMIRETLDPGSAGAILDVKPDGGLEFMARLSTANATAFIAGGSVTLPNGWLRLARSQNQLTAFQSDDGVTWAEIGTIAVSFASSATFVGLAVTSHDVNALNVATFDHVAVSPEIISGNLLQKGGFEEYEPPALGLPGWLSDDNRQLPAKSEQNQPHTGSKNGACWTTGFLDCGMYQTVQAPKPGTYTLTFFAAANRPGGLIGANVNGVLAVMANVGVRPFLDYGTPYTMTFSANGGDTIDVWMYSPAQPGYVVIDDVSLTVN